MKPEDVLDIDDLMEILNISREEANTLLARHDEYLKELAKLEGPTAVMLLITTAVAIASNFGITPTAFIRLVQDVILACASDSSSDYMPDIEA